MKQVLCIGLVVVFFGSAGCQSRGEKLAASMCERSADLEKTDAVVALQLLRKMWGDLPTAGTANANLCIRRVRERLGRARALVYKDKLGDKRTIVACEWAAQAVATFSDLDNPPFRKKGAARLMKKCAIVVGRAWARSPDSEQLSKLSAMCKKYADNK